LAVHVTVQSAQDAVRTSDWMWTVAALQHNLTSTSGSFVVMWHLSAVLPVSVMPPLMSLALLEW